MFIIIHQHSLNDTPTGVRTVLRLTIKGQKVSVSQSLEIPSPFPKIAGIILPLISLWNYPAHKNKTPHISESLAFWDSPHSVFGVCTSLNKSVFTLLQLALEFLPARSQGLSLGSPSQGLAWDLRHDQSLSPHFSINNTAQKGNMNGTISSLIWYHFIMLQMKTKYLKRSSNLAVKCFKRSHSIYIKIVINFLNSRFPLSFYNKRFPPTC